MMNKGIWLNILLFCTSAAAYSNQAVAEQPKEEEPLLEQMHQAAKTLTYEMSYIVVNRHTIQPMRYRHAYVNGKTLAELFYLSGTERQVLQNGNKISYLNQINDSFSISSGAIVAPLMPFLYADINKVEQYYDVIKVGRAREAGKMCDVIRVVAKDGLRYSYLLWVERESKLPIRADLIDRDGDLLEQYYTIALKEGSELEPSIARSLSQVLKQTDIPQELTLTQVGSPKADWKTTWVPEGFVANEVKRYRMVATNDVVESQLFSDGLFNFSIYVYPLKNNALAEQALYEGRKGLYVSVLGDRQIVVMGDIPLETAKTIAQSIQLTQ